MRLRNNFDHFRDAIRSRRARRSGAFFILVLFLLNILMTGVGGRAYSAGSQDPQERKMTAELSAAVTRKQAESAKLTRQADSVDHFREIGERVQSRGTLPVIVRLRAVFVPEGELRGAAETRAQRLVIGSVRDRMVDELVGYDPASVKPFDYLPFVGVTVNATGVEALRSSGNVLDIEEDVLMKASLAQSVPMIGANNAWASGYTGSGQVVAILDTGVDKSHPFLAGKVVSEACYSTTASSQGAASVCPGGASSSTSVDSGLPCSVSGDCDHGTHVAGIAAGKGSSFSGVAKDANVIAIQVFTRFNTADSCGGTAPCAMAFTSDIIKGLQRVYELSSTYNIAAANLSLGGDKSTSNCDSSNASTKAAIDLLRGAGVATVIASGNESYTNALGSPACISTAISVGSVSDSTAAVSSFSNSASFLSLLAPGGGITSSVPGAGFETWSGTSMATPHVAGAWAIMKHKLPTATVTQVLDAFTSTGQSISDSRNNIVKPLIKVDLALNLLGSAGPPPSIPVAPTALATTVSQTNQVSLTWTDNSTNESGFRIYRKTGTAGTAAIIATVGQNTTTYVNTAVSGSTDYYYYVVAYNSAGESTPSNEARATTLSLPTVPSNLTATVASATSINLSWRDTSDNETGFRIRRRTSQTGFWTLLAVVGPNVSTYLNTGLTTGRTFYYSVTAYNSTGESSLSNQASATTTQTSPPTAPTELGATASTNAVNLSWTDNSGNEAGFRISRKTGATGSWAVVGTVGQNVRSVHNVGLPSGVTYSYRVTAYNTAGESAATNEVTVTTLSNIPVAPTTLTATVVSTSQINLQWVDTSSNESGFRISRKTAVAEAWTMVGTVGPNETSFQNTGLTAGSTYFYRVTAYNSSGESAASNEVTVATPASGGGGPTAPSGLQATASTTNTINLAWVDASNNETGFQIQRKKDDTWLTIATVGANVTTYFNLGLSPGTSYAYRIVAVNGATPSLASNQVTVRTPTTSFNTILNGQSISSSVIRGSSKYYKLYLPTGVTQFSVTTSGSGDLDLYLGFSSQPTRSSFNCRSVSSTSVERCVVNTPASGDWHIMVYGYGATISTYSLLVTVQGGGAANVRSLSEDAMIDEPVAVPQRDGSEDSEEGAAGFKEIPALLPRSRQPII